MAKPAVLPPAPMTLERFRAEMRQAARDADVPPDMADAGITLWEDAAPVPANFIEPADFDACLRDARDGRFDWERGEQRAG